MITGNEPAMPAKGERYDEMLGDIPAYYTGLTIRQQFAAMAMQGILANEELRMKLIADSRLEKEWDLTFCVAKEAVIQADALITELNKAQ
jgi:hypothetical protein